MLIAESTILTLGAVVAVAPGAIFRYRKAWAAVKSKLATDVEAAGIYKSAGGTPVAVVIEVVVMSYESTAAPNSLIKKTVLAAMQWRGYQ